MLLTSRIVKEHKSRAGTIQTRFILGIKFKVWKVLFHKLQLFHSDKYWTNSLQIDPWKIWKNVTANPFLQSDRIKPKLILDFSQCNRHANLVMNSYSEMNQVFCSVEATKKFWMLWAFFITYTRKGLAVWNADLCVRKAIR